MTKGMFTMDYYEREKRLEKKYLDLCETVCEMESTPSSMVFRISFLKGKLQGLYTFLMDEGYPIGEKMSEEIKAYI